MEVLIIITGLIYLTLFYRHRAKEIRKWEEKQAQAKEKLFQVDLIIDAGEICTYLKAAKTPEEAEEKATEEYDNYVYSAHTFEIKEVDGFKIEVSE